MDTTSNRFPPSHWFSHPDCLLPKGSKLQAFYRELHLRWKLYRDMGVRQPPSRRWESPCSAISSKSHTLKHPLARLEEWRHQYVSTAIISSGSPDTIHQWGYGCMKFTCMMKHRNAPLLEVMLYKCLGNCFYSLAYVYAVKRRFKNRPSSPWNATNIKTASPHLCIIVMIQKAPRRLLLHKKAAIDVEDAELNQDGDSVAVEKRINEWIVD